MGKIERLEKAGAIFSESLSSLSDIRKRFTVNGTPTLVNSPYGKAMSFDGSTSLDTKIKVTDIISNDFTILFRAYCSSAPNTSNYYFSADDNGDDRFYLSQVQDSDLGRVGLSSWNETLTLLRNQWNDIAIKLDGTTGYFYVNGVLVGSQSSITVDFPSVNNIIIGNAIAGSLEITANIKDFAIFNRAFSTQEITDFSSNSLFDYEKNVVSEWDMSDINPQDIGWKGNSLNLVGTSIVAADIVNGIGGGKCLDFDGSADYLTASDAVNLLGKETGTMVCWVKRRTSSQNYEGIMRLGKDGSTYGGFMILSMSDGRIRYQVNENYASGPVNSTNVMTDNEWHFLALSCDGTNFQGYIDCVLEASGVKSTLSNVDGSFKIGKAFGVAELFDGLIDKPIWFDKGLTLVQLKDLMNATRGGRR